jgi:hypothetical protein
MNFFFLTLVKVLCINDRSVIPKTRTIIRCLKRLIGTTFPYFHKIEFIIIKNIFHVSCKHVMQEQNNNEYPCQFTHLRRSVLPQNPPEASQL